MEGADCTRNICINSHEDRTTKNAISRKYKIPPKRIAGTTTASRPSAVRVRLAMAFVRHSLRDTAIPAVTLSKSPQRAAIFFLVKVGPKGGRAIPFLKTGLPDPKLLARHLAK